MPKKPARNELRIIGGRWRARRIEFPTLPGLRPTPDRVRETVFNWLQGPVAGARCLDLFAGSGALGIEALSRGAAHSVFVDRQKPVAKYLHEALDTLGADDATVITQEAHGFLRGEPQAFDIVFLDPPFDDHYLTEICASLEAGGWLAPAAYIYIEAPSEPGRGPILPENWRLHRVGRAGAVAYHLARRGNQDTPDTEEGDE
jgi:16S rRNA (guanine966-N2)-methyltransferase